MILGSARCREIKFIEFTRGDDLMQSSRVEVTLLFDYDQERKSEQIS